MGQPINVVFTRSSKPGIYRFEVNGCLTGMDHERFRVDDEIIGRLSGKAAQYLAGVINAVNG